MYHNHPYDGWASSGHGQSSPWPGSPPPSVLGALPYPAAPTPSNLITYHITAFSPSVFNSKVAGPDGQVHFNITTDNEMPGYTVVKNMRNNSIALIEWRSSPFIEIRGLLSKQKINNWLRLSPDRSSRTMEVRGMRYTWAPHNQSINLYAGSRSTSFLASVSRTQTSISIQITSDALQLQMLETVIIAALLLQCGRNID